MKIKVCFMLLLLAPSVSFALTPITEKNVPIDRSEELVREAPEWFQPEALDTAPTDLEHRMNVLPYEEDRYTSAQYLVVPTLGLIAPIQFGNTDDQALFVEGKEVNIDPYLQRGIMYYHGTAQLGSNGNAVYFGHSNYLASDSGRYKTIFGNIMALDPEVDEVWFYEGDPETKNYKRHIYVVSESFETSPRDVSVMLPKGGSETTLIACTDGRNGRWIIRGTNKPLHYESMSNFRFLSSEKIIAQLPDVSATESKKMLISYLTERNKRIQKTKHAHANILDTTYKKQMIVEEIYVRKNTGQY